MVALGESGGGGDLGGVVHALRLITYCCASVGLMKLIIDIYVHVQF